MKAIQDYIKRLVDSIDVECRSFLVKRSHGVGWHLSILIDQFTISVMAGVDKSEIGQELLPSLDDYDSFQVALIRRGEGFLSGEGCPISWWGELTGDADVCDGVTRGQILRLMGSVVSL